MGVEDDDARFLNQFIIYRIDVLESAPADTQDGMVDEHGNSRFPHVHAHRHGRIRFAVAENGHQAVGDATVIKGQDQRTCQKEEPYPFIPEEAEEKDQGADAEPGTTGIGQDQAQGQDGKKARYMT